MNTYTGINTYTGMNAYKDTNRLCIEYGLNNLRWSHLVHLSKHVLVLTQQQSVSYCLLFFFYCTLQLSSIGKQNLLDKGIQQQFCDRT